MAARYAILAGFVRRKLREKFLEADIGMTGCNFAIAETRLHGLFENEGNARMVQRFRRRKLRYGHGADHSIWADLEVMATLLPRSATGQKLTVYMSGITGPVVMRDADGPDEMHIIIVDNGRSLQLGDPEFQELLELYSLRRLLECMSRLSSHWRSCLWRHYSGPIGAVLTPALKKMLRSGMISRMLPVCVALVRKLVPVKIPLHEMLIYLRRRKVDSGTAPAAEKLAFKGFYAMSDHKRLERLLKVGKIGQKLVARDGYIKIKGNR